MQIHPMRFGRDSLAEATHTLLLDFARADINHPLTVVQADWPAVFAALSREGLLFVAHWYLQQQPAGYPPPEFRQAVQRATILYGPEMAIMYQKIKQVLNHLNQVGLEYMVVKGPATAHTVYPEPGLRLFGDLDLVVRERDWTAAHRLLIGLGFCQMQSSEGVAEVSAPPPKFAPQVMIYEQLYYHPAWKLVVEVHYDDILNAGLAARNLDGFWQRSQIIKIDGIPLRVMSLEDQLVHLCMHIHYHGYNRLNAFTDIALLVRDHAGQLNWDQVLKTVQIEEAQVGVYYTLYYLEQLLRVSAPSHVMTTLRPDRFRRWWHEYYLPSEQVLSLEPLWRPDFSFYFIPLFKRLLPDLLVMGRRAEKLACLLRLLAPPAAWLRYYYKLDPTRNVAIHYALHPAKLLYHYLGEIMNLLLHRHIPAAPHTQYQTILP